MGEMGMPEPCFKSSSLLPNGWMSTFISWVGPRIQSDDGQVEERKDEQEVILLPCGLLLPHHESCGAHVGDSP